MEEAKVFLGVTFLFIIILAAGVFADMNSSNYIIVTEEVDSGGGETNSSNYLTSTVLGTVSGEGNTSSYIIQAGVLYGAVSDDANTKPTITLISPDDGNVTTDRTPTFTYDGDDAEGHSLVYDINVTKMGISLCGDYNLDVVDHMAESYTFSNDLLCLSDNGDYYQWRVRACENETTELLCSDWSSYRTINITSLVQVSLPVDAVSFGSMGIGLSRNTTNSSYDAIVLRNDGNCRINISINSTQIWDSIIQNQSSYFQSKINSYSGNATWAEISWFGIPTISGSVVVASDLNYSDVSDSLPIDVLVEVPGNEPPGAKDANVTLRAELSEVYGVA